MARRSNLVLVVDDALRRDRIGIHGGRARTPAFDRFARENLWFTNAVSQSPWTKPSIATLFTALHPSQHGVTSHPELRNRDDRGRRVEAAAADVLSAELTTLAEVLQAAGYATAAFVSNPWMDAGFGYEQGFELYDDTLASRVQSGFVVSARGRDWLRRRSDERPYFLYLHYMDTHQPYVPLDLSDVRTAAGDSVRGLSSERSREVLELMRFYDEAAAEEAKQVAALALLERSYDKGVEAFDRALQVLLEALAEQPGWERTAVVVTSDHGEALYERGYGNHGAGLFDDEVAVPLAARLPGASAAGPIACPVGLLDLLPTLCAHLGLSCPAAMAGRSFLPSGAALPPRYLVSEGAVLPRHRAIRNASLKLIWEPDGRVDGRAGEGPWSLFDLRGDPAERENLLAARFRSGEIDAAFERLSAELARAVAPFATPAAERAVLSEEQRERLRDLGYLE